MLCCRWQILKRESDDGFSHKPKLTPQQAAEAQQLLPELARKLRHNVSCALTFTHASPTTMQSAWHSRCAASKVPRHFSCHTVALPSTPSRSPCSEASGSHSIASGTLQPPHVRCDRSVLNYCTVVAAAAQIAELYKQASKDPDAAAAARAAPCTSGQMPEFTAVYTATAAFYPRVFPFNVSDEEYQAVALQVSEANQQRKRQREDVDNYALSLRLRARPLQCEPAAMQSLSGARDPRLDRRASPAPVGEAAVHQRADRRQQKHVRGSDGYVRLPLPLFALGKEYLGDEMYASMQQRLHETATAAAREQVLQERPQLLLEARLQGKQAAAGSEQQQQQQQPPQQQQQQQLEEGQLAMAEAPLADGVLDLERPDGLWELVCHRMGGSIQTGQCC